MTRLEVAAEASWIWHAGAATILWTHIIGGSLAILAAAVALGARKGSRVHAKAGHVFFVAMIVMAGIGGMVAPFLLSPSGQPKFFDSLAGFLTCYLVATGWMTVRRRPRTTGRFEPLACAFAFLIAAAAIIRGATGGAAINPDGYYFLAGLAILAGLLDLRLVLAGGLGGVERLTRHLWRMCLGAFVAFGSFFFGQQRVMPEWIQGSRWLWVPPLLVLAALVYWLLRLRVGKWLKRLPNLPALMRESAARE